MSDMRVALVACVKRKEASPLPARDLYQSHLFRCMRRYAESMADGWYILSAEHGVLHPEQVIAPYERTLNKMAKPDRVVWAAQVNEQLASMLPMDSEVIILAGQRYRELIVPFLRERGYSVSVPLEGLGIGKQMQRLKQLANEH